MPKYMEAELKPPSFTNLRQQEEYQEELRSLETQSSGGTLFEKGGGFRQKFHLLLGSSLLEILYHSGMMWQEKLYISSLIPREVLFPTYLFSS